MSSPQRPAIQHRTTGGGEGEVDFPNTHSRPMEMLTAIDEWYDELEHNLSTPMGNAQLNSWLKMQARIPYASPRNAILLMLQCPDASELRTFDAWVNNEPCTLKSNESAIWLWDPIVARKCPACGRGHFDHDVDSATDSVACTDTPPAQWSRDIVKYTPTALFDRSQMAGLAPRDPDTPLRIEKPRVTPDEHSPDLDECADISPNPSQLPHFERPMDILNAIPAVADELSISFTYVPADEWEYIEPVQKNKRDTYTMQPTVRALEKHRGDPGARVWGLLKALAYTNLAYDIQETVEARQRTLETKAAAYATALALGHRTSITLDGVPAPLHFEPWTRDDIDTVRERIGRVQTTTAELISAFSNTA